MFDISPLAHDFPSTQIVSEFSVAAKCVAVLSWKDSSVVLSFLATLNEAQQAANTNCYFSFSLVKLGKYSVDLLRPVHTIRFQGSDFLGVPKIGSCEHSKKTRIRDFEKNRWKQNMLYFHSTLLERWKVPTKTEARDRTVWTTASNFRYQESDRVSGPLGSLKPGFHSSIPLNFVNEKFSDIICCPGFVVS